MSAPSPRKMVHVTYFQISRYTPSNNLFIFLIISVACLLLRSLYCNYLATIGSCPQSSKRASALICSDRQTTRTSEKIRNAIKREKVQRSWKKSNNFGVKLHHKSKVERSKVTWSLKLVSRLGGQQFW